MTPEFANETANKGVLLMQRAFTIDEFCKTYRLGRTKTYAEINAGRLKAAKVGSKTIIRADDAEAWLANLADVPSGGRPDLPNHLLEGVEPSTGTGYRSPNPNPLFANPGVRREVPPWSRSRRH
jgi:excisionase family DNA binding protein